MSRENVELIRALVPTPETDLATLFRDDRLFGQAVVALESVVDSGVKSVAVWQGGATYIGMEGFRQMWLDWLEPWAEYHSEIEELIDAAIASSSWAGTRPDGQTWTPMSSCAARP
jgi:hypothetical protein